jgi:uncharacterized membrane protein
MLKENQVGPPSRHRVILWVLFFFICMGLGYPTLNRYDPRTSAATSDSAGYYSMVVGGTDAGDESHRILVPYLARPIYWLANNRLHTWNPVFFALLVVNSLFIATSASLLLAAGFRVIGDYSTAMLGAFIYMANFAVSNLNLSGMVDSAVNCLLMSVVWALLTERWWLLPIFGLLGALAKETFVPLALVLALAWWFTVFRRGAVRIYPLVWIAALLLVGFVTVKFLMSISPTPYSPLSFAASRWASSGSNYFYLSGFYGCLTAREFLYTFGWLIPLGIWRLDRLPRTWVIGSTCAALAALAMGAFDDALGNATRAVFSAAGPFLSLSVALFLVGTARLDDADHRPTR